MALGFFEAVNPQEQLLNPNALDRRRKLAELLAKDSMSTAPVQHWTQGAARVLQGLASGYEDSRLDKAEKANQGESNRLLMAVLGGGGGDAARQAAPAQAQAAGGSSAAGGSRPSGEIGAIINDAAKKYGIDPETMTKIAGVESSFNPNAKNPNSSASGLFQMTRGTARQYGLANPYDPAANADAAARLTRDNIASLSRVLGRAPTAGEVYLAHQQGAGGAAKLLSNPDAPVASVIGNEAARLNGAKPGMTAGQFAQQWIRKIDGSGGAPVAPQRTQLAGPVPTPDTVPRTLPGGGGNLSRLPDSQVVQFDPATGQPIGEIPPMQRKPFVPRPDLASSFTERETGVPTPSGPALGFAAPPPAMAGGDLPTMANMPMPALGAAPAAQAISQAAPMPPPRPPELGGAPGAPTQLPGVAAPSPQGGIAPPPAAPQPSAGNRAALVALLTSPYATPEAKQLGMMMMKDQMGGQFGFQTVGDQLYRVNQRTGQVEPVGVSAVKPQFGIIGEDDFGNKRYGFINPSTQQVTPYKDAPQAPASPQGQQQAASGQPPAPANAMPPAPPGVDPKVWRQEQTKKLANPDKLTEVQSKDVGFYTRGVPANDELTKLEESLTSIKDTAVSKIPVGGNYLVSEKYQKAENAAKDFLAVILRKDTGAAVTPKEFDEYGKIFLPRPGDSKETITQKRESRARALEGIRMGLGTAQAVVEFAKPKEAPAQKQATPAADLKKKYGLE